jgi:hypothetical protein
MLLKEMFSAIGAPKDDQVDVNWLDDLKFFIDNNDDMLDTQFFPAIKRHKEHQGNPNVYKVYIRPINHCKEAYCNKFEIEDADEKFPKEKLIELAKRFAEEQERHLEKGDYDK